MKLEFLKEYFFTFGTYTFLFLFYFSFTKTEWPTNISMLNDVMSFVQLMGLMIICSYIQRSQTVMPRKNYVFTILTAIFFSVGLDIWMR